MQKKKKNNDQYRLKCFSSGEVSFDKEIDRHSTVQTHICLKIFSEWTQIHILKILPAFSFGKEYSRCKQLGSFIFKSILENNLCDSLLVTFKHSYYQIIWKPVNKRNTESISIPSLYGDF